MTTESSSPAARDGTHDFELLDTKPALMSLDESTTQRAEDVGHLHGGPVHSFFFRPDRLIVSMVETVIASTGLVTECRCWVDRCSPAGVESFEDLPPTPEGESPNCAAGSAEIRVY